MPLKYKMQKHMSKSQIEMSRQPSRAMVAAHSQQVTRQPSKVMAPSQRVTRQPSRVKVAPASQQVSRQPTRLMVEPKPPAPVPEVTVMDTQGQFESPQQQSMIEGAKNRPSQLLLERKMTQARHLDNPTNDPERLQLSIDASSNLRQEPSDQEIRKQIQRWKTQYALEKNLGPPQVPQPPKRPLQPKHAKSFYELRKAMVNREDVSIEQSSYVIGSLPPTFDNNHKKKDRDLDSPSKQSDLESSAASTPLQDSKTPTPVAEKKKLGTQQLQKKVIDTAPKKEDLDTAQPQENCKVYDGEQKFEVTIDKEPSPGFNILTEVSESDKKCKTLVDAMTKKENEVSVRKEITELLMLWKTSGFLQSIEEYVLRYPAKKSNSVSEIAQNIAAANASYLSSISGASTHVEIAKAYAIYCWIANNVDSCVSLAGEYEEANFSTTSDDYSELYMKIALQANLSVEVIKGQVRTWANMTDVFLTPHSWNAVSSILYSTDSECLSEARAAS